MLSVVLVCMVNEELSYSRPRNFAQMPVKANSSTRKKHRMLRPRFLIVKGRRDGPELAHAGNAQCTAFRYPKAILNATTLVSDLARRERAGNDCNGFCAEQAK